MVGSARKRILTLGLTLCLALVIYVASEGPDPEPGVRAPTLPSSGESVASGAPSPESDRVLVDAKTPKPTPRPNPIDRYDLEFAAARSAVLVWSASDRSDPPGSHWIDACVAAAREADALGVGDDSWSDKLRAHHVEVLLDEIDEAVRLHLVAALTAFGDGAADVALALFVENQGRLSAWTERTRMALLRSVPIEARVKWDRRSMETLLPAYRDIVESIVKEKERAFSLMFQRFPEDLIAEDTPGWLSRSDEATRTNWLVGLLRALNDDFVRLDFALELTDVSQDLFLANTESTKTYYRILGETHDRGSEAAGQRMRDLVHSPEVEDKHLLFEWMVGYGVVEAADFGPWFRDPEIREAALHGWTVVREYDPVAPVHLVAEIEPLLRSDSPPTRRAALVALVSMSDTANAASLIREAFDREQDADEQQRVVELAHELLGGLDDSLVTGLASGEIAAVDETVRTVARDLTRSTPLAHRTGARTGAEAR